jgi:hypothetical protein
VRSTLLGLWMLSAASGLMAYPLQLGLASAGNAKIAFNGANDTFTFNNSTQTATAGRDFVVNVQEGFPGGSTSLETLLGNISGTYSIGAITTSGSTQTADVSGTGSFSIADGAGQFFTATLQWLTIQTTANGLFGNINTTGSVNLSNLGYSGSNADLIELAKNSGGSLTATFQFNPGKDLTRLTTDLSSITSYSASVSILPEPSFYGLLAIGMGGLFALTRRYRLNMNQDEGASKPQ